jgi:hypothetical protein
MKLQITARNKTFEQKKIKEKVTHTYTLYQDLAYKECKRLL